jgi:hypothetical protein
VASNDEPTALGATGRSHSLPLQLTPFVGREGQVVEVTRLLETTRLLTLVGAGGVGKTRLALRVLDDLSACYANGVWLVELAAFSEPRLVPRAAAATLGGCLKQRTSTPPNTCEKLAKSEPCAIVTSPGIGRWPRAPSPN